MKSIYNNLYQFSMYIQPMQFTIHQYLLMSDYPILISTGTMNQAEQLHILKNSLHQLNPKFIAVGHGFCVNCKEV